MKNATKYPKNDLAKLKRMAATPGRAEVGWERALGPTSRRLDISVPEAATYVLETVALLTVRDFVSAVQQRGVWRDVYGRYRDGLGWYVKIGETDDGVLVMSHHEPERGRLVTVIGAAINLLAPGKRKENHR